MEQRVRDLLGRMTLEEKFWQLFMIPGDLDDPAHDYSKGIFGLQISTGAATGTASARAHAERINAIQRYFVERTRLGIPIVPFEEAVHGLARDGATMFPQAIALAATWDTRLMDHVASAAALETRSRGIRQVLSPVVNIADDVRWGRVEETYGEDPFVASEMGRAFVGAFERAGVIATPKHLVANVGEGGRDSYPIEYSERRLLERYLPPFEAAIRGARARSVMTAYNSVDGLPATQNPRLLNDLLKKTWGFTGFVISDAAATGGATVLHMTEPNTPVAAQHAWEAGLDVVFQSSYGQQRPYLDAVQRGLVAPAAIDAAVARVLRAKFELGLFEQPYVDVDAAARANGAADHLALARQAAGKSIVLLKNDRRTLPLPDTVRSVAVIGLDAAEARLGGYSAAGVRAVSILDALRSRGGRGEDESRGLRGSQDSRGARGLRGSPDSRGGRGLRGSEDSRGGRGLRGSEDSRGGHGLRGSQDSRGGHGLRGSQEGRGGRGLRGSQDSRGGRGLRGSQDSRGGRGLRGSEDSRGGRGFDVGYAPGPGRGVREFVTVPPEFLRPPSALESPSGLNGEYFDNNRLEGTPRITRVDPRIDFRWTLNSPGRGIPFDWYSARWTGRIVSPPTPPRRIGIEGNDGYRLYLDDRLVIDNWKKQSYGTRTANVRWTPGSAHAIRLEYFESTGNARLKLIWDAGVADDSEARIAEAVALARRSDAAVVVAGVEEGEFRDRAVLALPGRQEALIRRVAATGKPTVVVLVGGSAVTMSSWIDRAGAVLEAWYPGERGGDAIADVLFGDVNPAGRLPITFPMSEGQLPLSYNHKPTGRGDDYVDLTGMALFPFGFGLSYTTFEYSNLSIEPATIDPSATATIRATVKNTGARAGDEVVQLYIRDVLASVARPVMELKGFQRVPLAPGASTTVTFTVGPDQLRMLDRDLRWIVEPGVFRLLLGASSKDIRLRGELTVR